MSTVRMVAGIGRWPVRHWRYTLVLLLVMALARQVDSGRLIPSAVVALLVPAVLFEVWATAWPRSFERFIAGPSRRWRWRRWARRAWPVLARECGLSVLREHGKNAEQVWVHPGLHRAGTRGDTLRLQVSARVGQTVEHLEAAAAAIGTAAGAVAWRTRPALPGVLVIDLVMRDVLQTARVGTVPSRVEVDALSVGRRQDGTAWLLPIRGRHTLVVGCSGSGKGSILWGIAAGLAPAIAADVARLWGVDLKRGVEIGMGAPLFTSVATTPAQAVDVLRRLLCVIDVRGAVMVGRSRLHEPTAGNPLHVLVIDELAALTAYADTETKREASRLLSEILTQGRALGVVVLACVQDPRKETVGMRGLFTQTIALRLRSAEETRMVLGDGTAAAAPAHRVSPSAPGSGWVIEDDGTADRVRADHWPDPLVCEVASRYPAPVLEQLAENKAARQASHGPQGDHGPREGDARQDAALGVLAAAADEGAPVVVGSSRARKPRSQRTPRRSPQGTPASTSGSPPAGPAGRGSAPAGGGWVA